MDLGLKGKTALVTGASTGLGAAAALALAQEGCDLLVNSRDEKRIQAKADEIASATGQQVEPVAADIATEPGIDAIAHAIAGKQIDILVSNTGGPRPGDIRMVSWEDWQYHFELVLVSAMKLTRLVIDNMAEAKWGRLIYITSVGVRQPIDDLPFSNTFRAGLTGYCKTVSNNFARFGITANCVCPGYTATERLNELVDKRAGESGSSRDDVLEGLARGIPVRRIGRPEELAAMVAYLAGEPAAYVTGQSILVDGGSYRGLV